MGPEGRAESRGTSGWGEPHGGGSIAAGRWASGGTMGNPSSSGSRKTVLTTAGSRLLIPVFKLLDHVVLSWLLSGGGGLHFAPPLSWAWVVRAHRKGPQRATSVQLRPPTLPAPLLLAGGWEHRVLASQSRHWAELGAEWGWGGGRWPRHHSGWGTGQDFFFYCFLPLEASPCWLSR